MSPNPELTGSARNAKEMDGAPIIAALLERFGKDYRLTEYKRTPPDRDLDPVFVDTIDATPAGGKAQNTEGPWVWCSECESPKFWHGIAITNETGALYLIGNKCATEFFGEERVQAARTAWKGRLEMQRARERFRRCRSVAAAVENDLKPFRKASTWESLNAVRRQFLRGAPDLRTRLLSAVGSGGGILFVMEPFIDTQGKSQLSRQSLGSLAGQSILDEIGVEKNAADSAHSTIRSICDAGDGANLTASALNSLAQDMENSVGKLSLHLDAAGAAHQFFDASNLARVVAFARQMRQHYQIEVGSGFLECVRVGKRYRIGAFEKLSIPEGKQLRDFCSRK